MPSITIRSADRPGNVTSRQATSRSAAGEVRRLGGGAREKLLQATENRTQYQLEASQQPAPTYYHGANRVKPLGANNAIRPRGFQANAPLGQGDRVTDQGGLIQATPRSNQGGDPALRNQVDQHGRLLAKLTPPAQQFDGDPNLETDPGTIDTPGRFDQDVGYDIASGTIFYWDNSVLEWVPFSQLWQGFAGTPAATVYIDGAIAINDSNKIYTGTVADGWTEFSGGGGGVSLVYYINGRTRDTSPGILNWTHPDSDIYREDTLGGVTRESDNSLKIAIPGIYKLSLTLQSNFGTANYGRIFIDTPSLSDFVVEKKDTGAPLTTQPLHISMIFETYDADDIVFIRYHSSDGSYIPGRNFASIGIEKL